jgi:hypothetical protein
MSLLLVRLLTGVIQLTNLQLVSARQSKIKANVVVAGHSLQLRPLNLLLPSTTMLSLLHTLLSNSSPALQHTVIQAAMVVGTTGHGTI